MFVHEYIDFRIRVRPLVSGMPFSGTAYVWTPDYLQDTSAERFAMHSLHSVRSVSYKAIGQILARDRSTVLYEMEFSVATFAECEKHLVELYHKYFEVIGVPCI